MDVKINDKIKAPQADSLRSFYCYKNYMFITSCKEPLSSQDRKSVV